MAINVNDDDQRAVEPGDGVLSSAGAAQVESAVPAQVPAQSPSAGGGEEAAPEAELEVNVGQQTNRIVFERFRSLFHDVPDDRFQAIVQSLRAAESINGTTRKLIEEGFCAHLHPTTVRMHLTHFREAMAWPRYSDQLEQAEPGKEDEANEVIEGQPVVKRLRWITRVQYARVRKALKLEGQMGGINLATTADDIKLMSALLDKELEVAIKTGDVKTLPGRVEIEVNKNKEAIERLGLDAAGAFRVSSSVKKVEVILAAQVRAILVGEEPGKVEDKAALIKGIRQRLASENERKVFDDIFVEMSGGRTSPWTMEENKLHA